MITLKSPSLHGQWSGLQGVLVKATEPGCPDYDLQQANTCLLVCRMKLFDHVGVTDLKDRKFWKSLSACNLWAGPELSPSRVWTNLLSGEVPLGIEEVLFVLGEDRNVILLHNGGIWALFNHFQVNGVRFICKEEQRRHSAETMIGRSLPCPLTVRLLLYGTVRLVPPREHPNDYC